MLERLLEQVHVAHRVLLQHAPKLLDDETLRFSTPTWALSESPLSHDRGLARAL
jgi:hypothetical protein